MSPIAQRHRTFVARSVSRLTLAALVATAILIGVRAPCAAGTPEQQCQNGRYAAAAKYNACEQRALAKHTYATSPGNVWIVVFSLGDVNVFDTETNDGNVRAVRAGL